MAEEINLELDIDEAGLRGSGDVMVRIAVAGARGFTRDGAAPTITEDCRTLQSLQDEIDRLKSELDGALAQASNHFSGSQKVTTARRKLEHADADSGVKKPHLGAELKVSQVMTSDVRTINENDQLSLADELMQAGKFRHLVVMNAANEVAGVVSHRDVFYSTIAWLSGFGKRSHDNALNNFPVKEVMNDNLVVVEPSTPLADAAKLMADKKIGCVPVVQGRELVGILTEGDFLSLVS
jgi:CBS domain-containing protein